MREQERIRDLNEYKLGVSWEMFRPLERQRFDS